MTTTPALLACNNPISLTGWTAASTTYYFGVGNTFAISTTSTIGDAQITERTSSTLSKGYINLTTNSRLTASTLKSFKNGSAGGISVSVTASTTGLFVDSSGTDSLIATDTFNMGLVTGSGTAAQSITSVGCEYDAASDAYTHFIAQQDGIAITTTGVSSTSHFNIVGEWSTLWQSADTDMKFPCRATGDYSNLYGVISANTRTAAMTLALRKTGAGGNNTVSITALTTGTFEDSTPHTDTVTNTDKLSGTVVTGSDTSHSATWQRVGVMFKGTASSPGPNTELVAHVSNSKSRGTTSDTFSHLTGSFNLLATTSETLVQDAIPFKCRLSNLRITSQTQNSTVTVTLRKNSGNGNQTLSVSASGVTEDSSNHDDISANDLVGIMFHSPGSSATSAYDGVAVMMQPPPISTGFANITSPSVVQGVGAGDFPGHANITSPSVVSAVGIGLKNSGGGLIQLTN